MSDTLGRKRVLAFSLLPTPAIMLAPLGASGWWRLPILVVLGFTGLMATPVIMASVQESFPEDRALANGVYMALSFAVRSMVVVLVGGVADSVGMRWTFLVCALLALVGAPFVAWLPGRSGRAASHSTDGGSARA